MLGDLPISELRFAAIDFESAGATRGDTDQPVQIGIAHGRLLFDEPELWVSYIATDAQEALDRVGITVNKNAIPFDTGSPMKPSGIRIGTPAVTTRGMKEKDVEQVAEFIARALALYAGEQVCPNPEGFAQLKAEISAFNRQFPLPR